MSICEYGEENEKTKLMFQCASEPSWVFETPAKSMARFFHVFFAAAPGHGPSESTTFTSIENYVNTTAAALKKWGIRKLDLLYGVSMGGGAALYLLAHQWIPVENAVIDAGIAPYPYPAWIRRLISYRDACLIPLAALSLNEMKKIMPPDQWTPEGEDPESYYERIYDFEKHHYSAKTNYNVLWSANNYSMHDPVPAVSTRMEYWYGSEESKARKADIAYVRHHFPHTVFHQLDGNGHARLVMCHPKAFAEEVMWFSRAVSMKSFRGRKI